MKKNLILMTALFAGTMLINEGFAVKSKMTKGTSYGTNQSHYTAPVETVQEPNYQEQLSETRGELENADNKYMIADQDDKDFNNAFYF